MDTYNIREPIFLQDNPPNRQEPHLVVMSPAYGYYHQNEIPGRAGHIIGHDEQRNIFLHSRSNNTEYVPEYFQKNLPSRCFDKYNNQTVMDYRVNTVPEKYCHGQELKSLKEVDLQERLAIQMNQCHKIDRKTINEHERNINEISNTQSINQSVLQYSSSLIPFSNKEDEIVKCKETLGGKSYTCGECRKQFHLVCHLHQHLLTHKSSGLYMFNIDSLTAYFRHDESCEVVETPKQLEDQREEKLKDTKQEQPGFDIQESITLQTNNADQSFEKLEQFENEDESSGKEMDKVRHKKSPIKNNLNSKTKAQDCLQDKTKSSKDIRTHYKTRSENKSPKMGKFLEAVNVKHKSEDKPHQGENDCAKSDDENITEKDFIEVDKDLDSSSDYSDVTLDMDYVPSPHDDQDKPYKCDKCGKQFKFEEKLKLHFERNHGHDDININNIDEVSHTCKWCQESFPSKTRLIKHIKICLKNDRLKCCICELFIPNKAERLKHLKTHDNQLDLTCRICNKVMKNWLFMQAHMKKHNRKKVVQCDQCGKAYVYKHLLKKHIAYCHTEAPINCEKCDMKFKTKEALKLHISVHSEEKTYVCHICGYTGKRMNYLNRHLRTHTGERPYSCNICGKKFIAAHGLNRHRKIHTNRKMSVCQYCGKAFTNNWNLKTHVRQHTGDTPYKCNVCGMGFKQNVLVKLHMKSHHPSESVIWDSNKTTE